ncbi:methyltransferase domain-containing protein [Micromonospora echinospora]|uniref:Ubiquinone/menaquinone biosynthesis C-methylase UbiE n=1 Tax=Micromonospora echinospora TaxID=1877 RepID=A0ABR6MKB0_MICEC|nr:class I SAM-dependent methyltransferase [Micromonospora echinospora]MBB5115831.1 ubiquinone/menaquinone biosynthesis C-methylase UbiE [Micromonospora echinospora]
MSAHRPPEPDVRRYYTDVYVEADRLERSPQGRLEARRTRDLLARLLPAAPADVLDVGGGPGAYAGPLAAAGYRVHLIDLVPAHVAAARAAYPLVTASVGDARALPLPDAATDATLLLGPLYHLPLRSDRVAALREAARVTRPGGPVVAAAISRNAALIDLTAQGRVDEHNRRLLRAEYETGVNDPRTGFTTAFFHRPEELVAEFVAAGLHTPEVYGVEGPLWPLLDALGTESHEPLFENAVTCAETFERDASILGASGHLLATARR